MWNWTLLLLLLSSISLGIVLLYNRIARILLSILVIVLFNICLDGVDSINWLFTTLEILITIAIIEIVSYAYWSIYYSYILPNMINNLDTYSMLKLWQLYVQLRNTYNQL